MDATSQKQPQRTTRRPSVNTRKKAPPSLAPDKLKLLFTIVNREKAELYEDLLQSFQVNMQITLAAQGTATNDILQVLGLSQADKAVILSVIRSDLAPAALEFLGEKFKTVKNGKGIAYTVPLSSTIGVAIYQFLCNNRSQL